MRILFYYSIKYIRVLLLLLPLLGFFLVSSGKILTEELLDQLTNTSLARQTNIKLLQKEAPHHPRKLIEKQSRSSSIFRQRLQQKGPTIEVLRLTSLPTVFTRPNKTCQIKNLHFFGTLILQTTSKIESLMGDGSNNILNIKLQEKS